MSKLIAVILSFLRNKSKLKLKLYFKKKRAKEFFFGKIKNSRQSLNTIFTLCMIIKLRKEINNSVVKNNIFSFFSE